MYIDNINKGIFITVKTGRLHSITRSGYCWNIEVLSSYALAACMHIHSCVLETETLDPSSSSRGMICLLHAAMHIAWRDRGGLYSLSVLEFPVCLMSSLQSIPLFFTVSRVLFWVFCFCFFKHACEQHISKNFQLLLNNFLLSIE